jgi:hypothetical protein
MYRVKDTAISSLRRNFYRNVDACIRTVESTLVYIESALKKVPCNKIFVAHYEQVLGDPEAYIEPLSDFLELDTSAKSVRTFTLLILKKLRIILRHNLKPIIELSQATADTGKTRC